MVSNPSKLLVESPKSSSSVHFNNDNESSDSSETTNSSSPIVKKHSEKKKTSKVSSESSSKAKYEKVRIGQNSSDVHKDKHRSTKDPVTQDSTVQVTPEPVLTPQQIRMKRIELLRKLSEIKSKGYKLSKEYDFNSSIEEMEYEYDLLKSFAERRNGIKLYKNTILNVSNIIEFFNNKYDPFGIKLDGWSEHMNVEIDSYDDVMEELYAKYRSTGKAMAPELKLFMLIAASASAFHFSKSYLTKMPGLDNIMSAQPEIMSKLINTKPQNKFMSEQELNIETQRREMQERDKQYKQQMRKPPQAHFQPQAQSQPQYQQPQAQFQPQSQSQPQQRPTVNFQMPAPIGTPTQTIQSNDPRSILQTNKVIKSSDAVKDILGRLHSREPDIVETQDETSSVNNDRLLVDTYSESSSGSKKNKKNKKSIMSVM